MIRLRHKLFIFGLRIFDQLMVAATLLAVASNSKGLTSIEQIQDAIQDSYQLTDIFGVIFIGTFSLAGFNHFVRYEANSYVGIIQQIVRLAKASTSVAFGLIITAALFDFTTLSPHAIVVFWATLLLIGIFTRLTLRTLLTSLHKSGKSRRHLLIVGINEYSINLATKIRNSPELGYEIIGFVDDEKRHEHRSLIAANPQIGLKAIGSFNDLTKILENGTVDEVMITLPVRRQIFKVSQTLKLCGEIGIVARIIPDTKHAPILKAMHIEQFEGHFAATFFRENLIFQLFAKRIMDIGVSIFMLIALSPLMIGVALAIKLTSKGPIFFSQERVGMNKRRFKLLKFRSMVTNAEELKESLSHLNEVDGPVFKIKKDPRITGIGAFIRKTSMDELPQLINVIKGDMSLVGPRPPLASEVANYEWLFRKRLAIKPGITCLWQVMGRNTLTFERWMELDKQYVDNWSIWLDIKILFMTVPVALTGHGAS